MTSRWKIRIALLSVAVIALGTTLLSLSYINQMAESIEQIANRDAKMAEMGESLSIQILQARREEKNFIIYLDTLYIIQNQTIINKMRENVTEVKKTSQIYTEKLDSIHTLLNDYSRNIQLLVSVFQEDPRTLYNLQRQIFNYEEQLRTLAKNKKLNFESLPSWTTDANIAVLSASAKLSAEKSRLFRELREDSDQINALAREITKHARESLSKNSNSGISYSVKAQRNTITLILVALLLLIYLIAVLPRKIFDPYKKMKKALQAVGRGEIDFSMPNIKVQDELGDLSRSFQDAVQKLQTFNELKSAKIIEIQRNLYRILEEIREAVVILTPELNILYINESARVLFKTDKSIISHPVKELTSLWEIIDKNIANLDKTGKYEMSQRIKKSGIKKSIISILPNINNSGKLENLLIIIK